MWTLLVVTGRVKGTESNNGGVFLLDTPPMTSIVFLSGSDIRS